MEGLGRVRFRLPVGQASGEVEHGSLVADGVGEVHPSQLLPGRGLHTGLLAEFASDTIEGRLAIGHATFGDLPRGLVHGVAVLPDEDDPVLRIDRDHAGRQVRKMDDAIDPRAPVRPIDLVMPDGDPRVLVGDAARPTDEAAIHRGIVAWRGRGRLAGWRRA